MEKHFKIESAEAKLLVFMVLAASLLLTMVMPTYAVDTTASVNPSSITVHKGDIFVFNVTLLNVSCLCGWEFKLWWNNTLLNCTQAEIQVPAIWINHTYEAGKGIQNTFNSTHGKFWKAQAALWPAPPFNGSMTLVTFTFKALNLGVATLDLDDVCLADSNALPISNLVYDGTVTVLPPPLYMRSDQHTVNNATMYKLVENHTQTGSSVNCSITDPENEACCYWGVRVWRRSEAGVETEITSGSPVAVVSRGASGLGLQSATWDCPNTNLSSTDCLVVRVYYKFDWTSYTQCGQFISLQLNATSLEARTWTVYYYTQRSYSSATHKTTMYYYWDNGYDSRIENVVYG